MIEKIKRSIPNLITMSRVIALIVGFILFIMGMEVEAICLYIYGSVSDAFDGYFARKWSVYSKLGSYLDAISDKFYALSIIILSLINRNYLIIPILVIEFIISVLNYKVMKENRNVGTVRVGKFKMAFEFVTLILSLVMIKIKRVYYVFVILLMLTIYFGIQSINAYVNKLNNREKKLVIDENDYKGKSSIQKVKLLFKEFKYYLFNPVQIIK